MSLKEKINGLDRFMFLDLAGAREDSTTYEQHPKMLLFDKKVFDIFCYLFLFQCFAWAGAIVSEKILYSATGSVTNTPLTFLPIAIWIIMIFLAAGLGLWRQRVWGDL